MTRSSVLLPAALLALGCTSSGLPLDPEDDAADAGSDTGTDATDGTDPSNPSDPSDPSDPSNPTDPTGPDMGTGDPPGADGIRVMVYGSDPVSFDGRLDLLDPETDTWVALEPAPYYSNEITPPSGEPNGPRVAWLTPGSELYVADAFDPQPDLLGIADSWFRWSPDGEWIAHLQAGYLNVVESNGTEEGVVLGPTVGSFAYEVEDVVKFSPDGTRVAWPGEADELFVTELASMETTTIVAAVDDLAQIDWLDDDTIFFGSGGSAYYGLFVVSAAGGAPELVTSDATSAQVRLGSTHALSGCTLYPIAGGAPIDLMPAGFVAEIRGTLSPSGDHALCHATDNPMGEQALTVAATAGGSVDTLIITIAVNEFVAYDGWVVLEHDEGTPGELSITRIDYAAPHAEHPIVSGQIAAAEIAEPLPGWDASVVVTIDQSESPVTVTVHEQDADGTNAEPSSTVSGLDSVIPQAPFELDMENFNGFVMAMLLTGYALGAEERELCLSIVQHFCVPLADTLARRATIITPGS